MGEAQDTLFEPEFNRAVKVQTSEQRITSHAGAVLLREADHRLGLVESLARQIDDPRDPEKIRYTATELLRERIYALALGSEDQDDLDRLAHDPAMRMAQQGFAMLADDVAVKHMIIISDGDPTAPKTGTINRLMQQGVKISTVEVPSHGPAGTGQFGNTMRDIAEAILLAEEI